MILKFFREGLGSFARRTQRTKKFDPFVLDGLDADSPWYIASYIHVSHRLIVYESYIMKEIKLIIVMIRKGNRRKSVALNRFSPYDTADIGCEYSS